jgi:hypothetical protein
MSFDRAVGFVIGAIIIIALIFANFHLTTDHADHKYGKQCHYDQVGNWIGAISISIDCTKPGAP